jgi:hypothetical protein
VVYKSQLPEWFVDGDGIVGCVRPLESVDGHPMAWWWIRRRTQGRGWANRAEYDMA